jgi:hypothetical protein
MAFPQVIKVVRPIHLQQSGMASRVSREWVRNRDARTDDVRCFRASSDLLQWLKWHRGVEFIERVKRIPWIGRIQWIERVVWIQLIESVGGVAGNEAIEAIEWIVWGISVQ